MQETICAIVNEGRLEPVEELSIPDGTEVLVTIVTNGEFWLDAGESSLEAIWGNPGGRRLWECGGLTPLCLK